MHDIELIILEANHAMGPCNTAMYFLIPITTWRDYTFVLDFILQYTNLHLSWLHPILIARIFYLTSSFFIYFLVYIFPELSFGSIISWNKKTRIILWHFILYYFYIFMNLTGFEV